MSALRAGQGLRRGESLDSSTGKFVLALQEDGNLTLSDRGQEVWASGTHGQGVDRLDVQDDGNVVLYAGGDAKWSTGTHGNSGASLTLQDDRNVVVYSGDGQPLWATNTGTDDVDSADNGSADYEDEGEDDDSDEQEYVVESGDTLWGLAERFYGDGSQYTRIAEANDMDDPNILDVGQVLIIPA
ncbi:hypothetical protein KEM60_02421 [Austwickia sp. TVS 96-490-7B]|uniref:LysM peptidoglycan-binding domain-containing protein n=1 Tax=Austwickia sp. TVS 96-490-7B TaxID=2830843 RepID=UPI001C55B491|nr:LysM peptidoglycan-binding domain-containing protein [Austwickia sp. TVS 96-490-7B]MBW3086210.1 hypothetical protein [Austwickia sp. TVS 96-490-7B]